MTNVTQVSDLCNTKKVTEEHQSTQFDSNHSGLLFRQLATLVTTSDSFTNLGVPVGFAFWRLHRSWAYGESGD